MRTAKKVFSVFLCWTILWSQSMSINASQTNEGNTMPPTLDEVIKLSSERVKNLAEAFLKKSSGHPQYPTS